MSIIVNLSSIKLEQETGVDPELDFGGFNCVFHLKSFLTLWYREHSRLGACLPGPPESAPDRKYTKVPSHCQNIMKPSNLKKYIFTEFI